MEEEIVAEFNKSGFALDEEEILKKWKYIAVAGMICCDGEGRQNEEVHHAAKQVVSLVEGQGQRKIICINPGRLAKGEGGGTFAELKYHGSADKMNACIIRSI